MGACDVEPENFNSRVSLTLVMTVGAMLKRLPRRTGNHRCFEEVEQGDPDYGDEAVWCSSRAAQEPHGGSQIPWIEGPDHPRLTSIGLQPAEHPERLFQA